jgi:hypothetical protein
MGTVKADRTLPDIGDHAESGMPLDGAADLAGPVSDRRLDLDDGRAAARKDRSTIRTGETLADVENAEPSIVGIQGALPPYLLDTG